jgi:NAD(P)-dependent dehydrogenase (short-subunit alcohol dehydrogenase family)
MTAHPGPAAKPGRRVLISGGTSGIGFACAKHLLGTGAAVFVLGSRAETLATALEQLPGARGAACDVSHEAAVDDAVHAASAAMGGIDGVFVNAGIDGQCVPAVDLELEHFRRVLEVNVLGAFLVARAALRVLQRPGCVVFNASVNALRPERNFCDYNASKAAVVSMAKTMALELGGSGVTVVSVCPGYFPTPMTVPYMEDQTLRAQLLSQIPAGRFGSLEELARLVEFLLSPSASFMHGSVVSMDGGAAI